MMLEYCILPVCSFVLLIFYDSCVVSYVQFTVSVLYYGYVTSIHSLLAVVAHKSQVHVCEGNYFFFLRVLIFGA